MNASAVLATGTGTNISRIHYGSACKCCKASKVKCTGEVLSRKVLQPLPRFTCHPPFQRPCQRCVRLGEVCIDAPKRRALKFARRSTSCSPSSSTSSASRSNSSQQLSGAHDGQCQPHSPDSAAGSNESGFLVDSHDIVRHCSTDTADDGFNLAEVLLALQGSREARFNAGSFLLESNNEGLARKMLHRMQAVIQASSHIGSAGVLAAMGASGGKTRGASLPLRLLFAAAPQAHAQFMRSMIQQGPSGLHIAQGLSWDGLHFGVVGMAAAVLAWRREEAEVMVPPGYFVISSPHACVATSKEGGGFRAPRMRGELQGILGRNTAPMSLLLERWPHLARVLDSACAPDEDAALEFLSALVDSAQTQCTVAVPARVFALHKQHVLALPEAAACSIFVAGRLSGYVYGSDSFADLIGVQAWLRALPELAGSGQDAEGTPKWMHHSSLLRRCLAFISARHMGLHSFQYEGKYVRAIGLRDSPGTDRAATVLDDMLYSSYYGIESIFEERTPHGQVLACCSYMSDIMFEREPIQLHAQAVLSAELDVIEQLILPSLHNLPLEVQLACKKSGVMPLTAFRDSILDPELEKIRLRCLLLLVSHPALSSQALPADAPESKQPGASASGVDSSDGVLKVQQETLRQRVKRIAQALVEQIDQSSLQRVKEDMIISLGGTGIHSAMELHCGSHPIYFSLPTAHGRKLIAHILGVEPEAGPASGCSEALLSKAAHETALACVPFF